MLRAYLGQVVIVALGCFGAAFGQMPGQAKFPEGVWEGPLRVGPVELLLAFHLSSDKDGAWKATMDSIDQGAIGIPCDSVKVDGKKVTIELGKLKAQFEGTSSTNNTVLKGTFTQRGMKFPLSLNRVEKASTRKRPQTPKKPYPYGAEEVVFENPKAGIKLAGTLTMPKEGGPFPAVVLVTGSGPQDRDETLLGHKPFLVLADHLTRKGIAVLRFDDRGVGKSKGDFNKATSADFATDAFAAMEYLANRKEIDSKRIGLAGHSEGGLIAPMVAAEHPDKTDFIVMLAGTGAKGDAIIERQTQEIGKASGATREGLEVSARLQKLLMDTARSQPDEAAAKKALAGVAVAFAKKLSEAEKKALEIEGNSDEGLKASEEAAATFASPWMRFFLNHDPTPVLARVKCPVLAVNGSLDLQVLPDQNMPLIEKSLKEGGNTRFKTKLFPGLNHLFQHAKTGQLSEYGQIEETMAPEVMELVASWISGK
jgi:fermentation-respiration switch protein FrsA (DUF1100 family)